MVRGVTSDLQTRRISQIHKRLGCVQRNLPLSEREFVHYGALVQVSWALNSSMISLVIPVVLEDSRKFMENWGSSGTFEPFDKIYEVPRVILISIT